MVEVAELVPDRVFGLRLAQPVPRRTLRKQFGERCATLKGVLES